MYKSALHGWLRHLDFILWDEFSLFLAILLTGRIVSLAGVPLAEPNPFGIIMLLLVINLSLMIASDSLSTVIQNDGWKEFKITLRHSFFLLSSTILGLLVRDGRIAYPRVALFIGFVLYLAFSYVTRVLWRRVVVKRERKKETQKSLLVVTYERYAHDVVGRFKQYAFGRYAINGLVLIDRDATGETIDGISVVASLDGAADYICRSWIDEVLFFRSSLDEPAQPLIALCREMALTLHFYSPVQGVDERKQVISWIAGFQVLSANLNTMSLHDAFLRRAFDLCIGVVGSFMALAALAILGPIIKKASPGPLLFKQVRIGENGKKFVIYKIRSMHTDADRRKEELEKLNSHKDGMLFKMDFDPRVIGNRLMPDGTQRVGIGDFIRRTHLDELPQFFNVLRGDMSVVGTRPPTVDEWEKYQYHHRARLSIRPGMTGLWQINRGKDIMPFDEVVRLDTEYISNWSVSGDVRIIAKTFAAIIRSIKI